MLATWHRQSSHKLLPWLLDFSKHIPPFPFLSQLTRKTRHPLESTGRRPRVFSKLLVPRVGLGPGAILHHSLLPVSAYDFPLSATGSNTKNHACPAPLSRCPLCFARDYTSRSRMHCESLGTDLICDSERTTRLLLASRKLGYWFPCAPSPVSLDSRVVRDVSGLCCRCSEAGASGMMPNRAHKVEY